VGRWERVSRKQQFQQQISNLNTALQRSLNRYTELLYSLGDVYHMSNNQVSQADFSRFVQRALSSYPGIQALEWAPRVTAAERSRYEVTLPPDRPGITERNVDDVLILARPRPEYVPVTYIEPLSGNEVALGYDLASDETRRIALERARDTGQLAATARVRLVQETADAQYSFLVFLPIYDRVAVTPAERRRSLEGYVLGVFRVADVVEESLQDLDYNIDFYIRDRTAPEQQQFLGLYASNQQQVISVSESSIRDRLGQQSLCATEASCTQVVSFGQREWVILFLPASDYGENWQPWGAIATFCMGLLLTLSIAVYVWRSQTILDRTRELSDLKLRFFSMASHELRTPLSTILLTAQSLETNQLILTTDQKNNAIERIHTSARRMAQLLDDILTLTRAEAGKLEFSPEIVDIRSFCQIILDDVQPQAKPHQDIQITFEIADPRVYLDCNLGRSLLHNLLSNALKYSPSHSTVELRVQSTHQTLQFQVIDSGIGIPVHSQHWIFDAFYRGSNVGNIPGTGLGLSVVRTCVECHNGAIHIHSRPQEGTIVTVELPQTDT
jgi:signal transduction histidine kinase